MRILHLPSNVAGLPIGLVEGERALGHESHLLTLTTPVWGHPVDHCLALERRNQLGRWWAYARALAWDTRGYDLYTFNFGSSILHFPGRGQPLLDLPFYPRGARKIFIWQGCDARQRDATSDRARSLKGDAAVASCLVPECGNGACTPQRDRERRGAIEKAARYADHMFAVNPDLLDALPPGHASFLPYTVAGFHSIPPKPDPFFANGRVNVVHSATDRTCKGSAHVLAAMAELSEEFGDRVGFTFVEGLSWSEARRRFSHADLFIDQVLTGWYGGVSVELMKMGIPTVAFINPDHLARTPEAFAAELPVVGADPSNLKAVLRDLIRNRERLPELGAAGRRFVERWHAPERVAAHVLATVFGSSGRLWT